MSCGELGKVAKTEHTPEPWEWSKHKFNSPPFEGTLEQECGIYPPLGESGPVAIASGEANARRIVACVNACAGVEDPSIYPMAKMLRLADEQRAACFALEKQRDGLLAAMNKLSGMKLNMIADGIVDKAIASVKGGVQ